jgi:hypothetical protein
VSGIGCVVTSAAVLSGVLVCAPAVHAQADARVTLEDETGAPVDPLERGDDVRVFVFVRRDCPFANRYAPEFERLRQRLSAERAPVTRLWMVYVDPADTPVDIRAHQREYGLQVPWLVDRTHAFVARTGATVTPEAVVYGPSRGESRPLVYRGRIDDRVVDVGRVRPAATVHELADAIAAARQGRPARAAGGPPVGCFISDAR